MKYYAVPPYKGNKTFRGEPHVVNEDGELVAVFEDEMNVCEMFVKCVNDLPEKAKMLHKIINNSRLRNLDTDDFLTEDEEIFDALLDLENLLRDLNLWQ